jgi:Polyketide cyclase / dehydrase and lipid transport
VGSPVDVSVDTLVAAPPSHVRAIMFDPRQDPGWMAAVTAVEPLSDALRPGALVRRTGRFLGRTLRWTTEVTAVSDGSLDLTIVDGPMRGTVAYRIDPEGRGSRVTIRNVGEAPGFAPRWLLAYAMRRSLTADLRRLRQMVERAS